MTRPIRSAVRRPTPLNPDAMENTGQVRCPAKAWSSIARQRCVEFQGCEGCTCPSGEVAWALEEQHQRDNRDEDALRAAASARYRAEYRANGAARQVRLRREPGVKCIVCGEKKRRKGRATCGKRCERAARRAGGTLAAVQARMARSA